MLAAGPDILHSPFILRRGEKSIDLSSRTHIMGVLNVTPDSFSDGGKFFDKEQAVAHALQMVRDGADIIDVGGESTRPKGPYGEGAEEVTADEEIRRVVPVIEELSSRSDVLISVDTYKSAVADAALRAGAAIVNDISGLNYDAAMASVAAAHGAALIVMHIQGTPKTMQHDPVYKNVVEEVKESLSRSVEKARDAGVENILVDPGIGFGKRLEHNLSLIRNLHRLAELHCPIVIGPSRKGFIGTLLNLPVDQRVEGTAAAVAASVIYGANIVRVHDVKEMKRIAVVVDAIMEAR
ncbi:MAG TPA: dihydropteroate synthase [Bacteroidota bacterium]|nr:dihydropteroate synthase [Bacteroidota bacterium]